jgi:hypothetical protein
MAVGFALGLVATATSVLADRDDALVFNAILLAWIGSVYLGFAIADGRRTSIGVQIVSALVFLELGYYGYQLDSRVMTVRDGRISRTETYSDPTEALRAALSEQDAHTDS